MGEDAEGGEGGVRGKEGFEEGRVCDLLLDDPIAARHGVGVEMDAHAALNVAVLHHDGAVHVGGDGDLLLDCELQEGELRSPQCEQRKDARTGAKDRRSECEQGGRRCEPHRVK